MGAGLAGPSCYCYQGMISEVEVLDCMDSHLSEAGVPSLPLPRAVGQPAAGSGKLGGYPILDPGAFLGSAWADARPTIKPLYKPGGLVLMRGGDRSNCSRVPFSEAYEVHPRPLGWGAFGSVVAATQRRTGAIRAVKSVFKEGGPQGIARARREAAVLAGLDHPNIVRLHEVIESDEKIYLLLELCEGGDFLEYCNRQTQPLAEPVVAALLWQMLSALQHLHARGFVHRDVKPEHFIFLRRPPDDHQPGRPPGVSEEEAAAEATLKLIDFGLARRINEEAPLSPRCGTPAYMPSEAHEGQCTKEFVDRCDMWAFGVILHCMLGDKYPGLEVAELTAEEYFSEKRWANVSPLGKDLLWQLLRPGASSRLSSIAALRHPWFSASQEARRLSLVRSLQGVGRVLPTFVGMPRLWQLAMVAAAREIHTLATGSAVLLYQALEHACSGRPTQEALRAVAEQLTRDPVGEIAAELCSMFDAVDMDGSGTLEFSELAALMLGTAGKGAGDAESSSGESQGCASGSGLSEDICWRAFNLLSQGGEVLSGAVLDKWLSPAEAARGAEVRRTSSHRHPGIDEEGDALRGASARMFDQMVREVDASGFIGAHRFLQLLQGGDGDAAASGGDGGGGGRVGVGGIDRHQHAVPNVSSVDKLIAIGVY